MRCCRGCLHSEWMEKKILGLVYKINVFSHHSFGAPAAAAAVIKIINERKCDSINGVRMEFSPRRADKKSMWDGRNEKFKALISFMNYLKIISDNSLARVELWMSERSVLRIGFFLCVFVSVVKRNDRMRDCLIFSSYFIENAFFIRHWNGMNGEEKKCKNKIFTAINFNTTSRMGVRAKWNLEEYLFFHKPRVKMELFFAPF